MNKIEEHIENIEKRIMNNQEKNGFDTVFDFIIEDIASIKDLVKNYDFSHPVSKRYAWLSPEGRSSNLWDEETHKNNITDEDIKEAESRGWKLLKFNVC
tara:strand:+ start:257 stop:553 length:297 start_codon:yes stop_codon:yes gene_type:complete